VLPNEGLVRSCQVHESVFVQARVKYGTTWDLRESNRGATTGSSDPVECRHEYKLYYTIQANMEPITKRCGQSCMPDKRLVRPY
jgi:hypothetical protein